MVGALTTVEQAHPPCRSSAGPAVSHRRPSPHPRSPHCCRCCDEAPIAAVVVPAPFSLSSFSRSLSCSSSLSLSRALARVSSRFSRSLSLVFSFLVLSLSLLSRMRVSHSRVFSLSLSLSSRTRVSPRACSLFLSLSHSRSLSFSSQCWVRPLHLPCHVPRGVPSVTVPPLPQAVTPHLLASAAPHRVTSRPRGVYTPPRWEQTGSTPATIYPRGRCPAVQGSACGVVTAPGEGSRVATAR